MQVDPQTMLLDYCAACHIILTHLVEPWCPNCNAQLESFRLVREK
jgi:uncharacterized paraquat-inducible protein A